eukprot:10630898-Karenia_brevis.AAC.1
MKAECNTEYLQCRLQAAGTAIQSSATCISDLVASIFACSPGVNAASPAILRHRCLMPCDSSMS